MEKLSKRASRSLFSLFSLFFLSSFNPAISTLNSPKNGYFLFFDLGDVLLETNKGKAFLASPGVFIKNVLKHGIPNGIMITERMFNLIDHQTGYPARGSATATCENIPMPALMCSLMCGEIDSIEFVEKITNINSDDPFFKSHAEGDLIKNTVKMLLPKNLVKINRTTSTLKVFHKCCEHDASRICILSNWDKSSIELLKKQFPEIFAKINENNILFSGELGCKKPDAEIFYQAANKLGVHPSCCVLIDDQISNTAGAEKCGWKTILHTNAKKTAKILNELYDFPCV